MNIERLYELKEIEEEIKNNPKLDNKLKILKDSVMQYSNKCFEKYKNIPSSIKKYALYEYFDYNKYRLDIGLELSEKEKRILLTKKKIEKDKSEFDNIHWYAQYGYGSENRINSKEAWEDKYKATHRTTAYINSNRICITCGSELHAVDNVIMCALDMYGLLIDGCGHCYDDLRKIIETIDEIH